MVTYPVSFGARPLAYAGGAAEYQGRRMAVAATSESGHTNQHMSVNPWLVASTMLTVHVVYNQQVDAGTVLVEVDPRDYQGGDRSGEGGACECRVNGPRRSG